MNKIQLTRVLSDIREVLQDVFPDLDLNRSNVVDNTFGNPYCRPYISLRWAKGPSEKEVKSIVKQIIGNRKIKVVYWCFVNTPHAERII